MEIANVILFILASIGMTHIIVDGSIFEGVRNWLKKQLSERAYGMLECYQCTGFWCGLVSGYFTIAMFLPLWTQFPITFFCGCASSYLSALAALHLNVLEARTVIDLNEQIN